MPAQSSRVHRSILIALPLAILAACGADAAESTSTTGAPTTTSIATTTSTSTSVPAPSTSLPGPPPADLLVVGDWGVGTLPQGAVAGAMQRYASGEEVAAVLTTGDNFYSDDYEFLMQPFGWVEEQGIPFWIAWGNHDVESPERIDIVNEVFDSPPRWATYEWGPVDVVVLDSNQITSTEQASFLLDALASSTDPTILVMHHPPYSCSHHSATIEVVNALSATMDDDVVLVLSGHDHNYQRFTNDDVTYVVSGGGGADLYDLKSCPDNHPPMEAGEKLHHFLALSQDGENVTLRAIDVNGAVFDEVSALLD